MRVHRGRMFCCTSLGIMTPCACLLSPTGLLACLLGHVLPKYIGQATRSDGQQIQSLDSKQNMYGEITISNYNPEGRLGVLSTPRASRQTMESHTERTSVSVVMYCSLTGFEPSSLTGCQKTSCVFPLFRGCSSGPCSFCPCRHSCSCGLLLPVACKGLARTRLTDCRCC